jgi:hypothetical protein
MPAFAPVLRLEGRESGVVEGEDVGVAVAEGKDSCVTSVADVV